MAPSLSASDSSYRSTHCFSSPSASSAKTSPWCCVHPTKHTALIRQAGERLCSAGGVFRDSGAQTRHARAGRGRGSRREALAGGCVRARVRPRPRAPVFRRPGPGVESVGRAQDARGAASLIQEVEPLTSGAGQRSGVKPQKCEACARGRAGDIEGAFLATGGRYARRRAAPADPPLRARTARDRQGLPRRHPAPRPPSLGRHPADPRATAPAGRPPVGLKDFPHLGDKEIEAPSD